MFKQILNLIEEKTNQPSSMLSKGGASLKQDVFLPIIMPEEEEKNQDENDETNFVEVDLCKAA